MNTVAYPCSILIPKVPLLEYYAHPFAVKFEAFVNLFKTSSTYSIY
jgi:hypothetical protein